MANHKQSSPTARFLRRVLGWVVNGLVIVVGGTAGVGLAGYFFAPSMLASFIARQVEGEMNQHLRGTISVRNMELGWGATQTARGIRLLDDQGNLLLEGDISMPSPWAEARRPVEVNLTGGRLVFDEQGVLNLLRVAGDSDQPGQETPSWLAGMSTLDMNLNVLEGGRGLNLRDERNENADLLIPMGSVQLSLDLEPEGGWSAGSLRVNCSLGDVSHTGQVNLSLSRTGQDAGLVGQLNLDAIPGAWADHWLGTSGEFAAWIEDVFFLSMTLEEAQGGGSTISTQLTEREGTSLNLAGSLDSEGLRLLAVPGACRISAEADLLIGGLGPLLEPELTIAKTRLLEGRLRDGGFFINAANGESRIFFTLAPDVFPEATHRGSNLAVDVSSLRVDFRGQDRRAWLIGSLDGVGEDLRFALDVHDTLDSPAEASLSLMSVSPSQLESRWGLPPVISETLGELISARILRGAVGEPLRINASNNTGGSIELTLDELALDSVENKSLDLLCPLDDESFAVWVQPLVPWIELLGEGQAEVLPIHVESFHFPLSGDLKELEIVLSLDFSGIPIRLVGALDRVLADGQPRDIDLGLVDPIRVRIAGGTITYEGFTLPLGDHEVDAEGTLDLLANTCQLALEIPLDILHPGVLGLARDFPRGGLSSMTMPVQLQGDIGDESLQVDSQSLLRIREFLDPLLKLDR